MQNSRNENSDKIKSIVKNSGLFIKRWKLALIIAAFLIIGVFVGVLLTYFTGVKSNFEFKNKENKEASLIPETGGGEDLLNEAEQQTQGTIESAIDLTEEYVNEKIIVGWNDKFEEIKGTENNEIVNTSEKDGAKIINYLKINTENFKGDINGVIYKAGKIKIGDEKNLEKNLYHFFVAYKGEEGICSPLFIKFLGFINNGKIIAVIKKAHDETDNFPINGYQTILNQGFIYGYFKHDFNELVPDKSLKISGHNFTLNFTKLNKGSFCKAYAPFDNALGITNFDASADGYENSEYVITTENLSEKDYVTNTATNKKIYYKDGCYSIKMPNGAIALYEITPYFIGRKDLERYGGGANYININWQRKNNASDSYLKEYEVTGCGSTNGCFDLLSKAWFSEKNLIEIGRTKTNNEPVYELSDKSTNEFYKTKFEEEYSGFQIDEESVGRSVPKTQKERFEAYLEDQPLFFWQDTLGKWHVYKKAKYRPSAECGKPVIYLYPKKDLDINVKVEPNGGFTKTEPIYLKNGWSVRATPNSELYNYSDKKSYPYLFWEGRAYDMTTPDAGFVLKKEEVGDKMKNILGKLGLNEKETKDFLEFWQEKLEVKPYVFVTFVPQSEFDKLAPLNIVPKPDKVIRVFMDYTPLDNTTDVRPLNIITPERSGFTVVEWGGRLHK